MKHKYLFAPLLIAACLLPLFSACSNELPADAQPPDEFLTQAADEFWNSEVYETAIFEAMYARKDASEALNTFNKVNALNAKNRIMVSTTYEAETISVEGRTAVVKLKIHGIDFGKYAEAYLEAFDAIQANIIVVDGAVMGITAEEASMQLHMIAFSTVSDDQFEDYEQLFTLKYESKGWKIKEPSDKDGRALLEPFARNMTAILNDEYEFRPGYDER